jgi:hypothetical protein
LAKFKSGVVILVAWFAASSARAHNGPAEQPYFGETECITVVDKRETSSVEIPYSVSFDDVLPEDGHIRISDSKTHQFYAFRGALVPLLPEYELRPVHSVVGFPLSMPLWIDMDDLARAEAANLPTIAPDFHAADIGDNVLHARADLALFWLPIGVRVPITIEQAMRGVSWDVSDVPAGLYQVVGFTFSPPYNAWEPRPGWFKIVDGEIDVPAVTVETVDSSLFQGQGQRVTGCVNAAEGSTLQAWFSPEGAAEPEWHQFASDVPVDGGRYELCFQAPPGLAAVVRVRVGVTAPNGAESVAYAPDRLVLIGTPADCAESASVCCEASNAASMSTLGVAAAAAAGAAAPTAAAPAPAPAAASGSCSVAPRPLGRMPASLALVWVLALAAFARRRSRPSRRAAWSRPFS